MGLEDDFNNVASNFQKIRLSEIKRRIIFEGNLDYEVNLDYLFKRPLVRLRYYSKLYKVICFMMIY
jgi:hypothetical protein